MAGLEWHLKNGGEEEEEEEEEEGKASVISRNRL